MKRALVYNRYLHTAGGGERLTLDWCLALSKIGYRVTFVTDSSFDRTLQDLCAVFGIPADVDWRLERIDDERDIGQFCAEQKFDLFVNGTFCSSLPNPAPVGIYSLMFPQYLPAQDRVNLSTYQRVLCISEFSKIFTHLWWGNEFPVQVLPPPISDSHMKASGIEFARKEKLILNVGRFNVDGHCKRQLDAIQTFNRLLAQGVLDKEWQLYCVGNLNAGAENLRYLGRCRYEAGSNVRIETDVSFERLQDLYRRACVLWQFTGSHLKVGVTPQHCEHLGLVAMDSMCYGALPMVYERSGVGYMIEHGKSGFVFGSTDELGAIMSSLGRAFGSDAHQNLFTQTRNAAQKLGFESFVGKLDSYISEIVV